MRLSSELPPQNRGLTAIAGAMFLIVVLLIVQIWLLSAALESFLAGHRQAALPALNMSLKGIPTGTLDGSLNGSFMMSGDLSGQVSLALTFTGQLEAGADGGVNRKAGTTHITGTATSPAGTYNVDVTR